MHKICHVTTVHEPFDMRIFAKECVSLVAADYNVHLAARHTHDEIIKGVTITALPKINKFQRFRRILFLPFMAYRACRKINASLYHIHDPELLPLAWILKWHGYKVIIDMHEDYPADVRNKQWIAPLLRNFISNAMHFLIHAVARRVDAVVVATPRIAETLRGSAKHIAIVNNYPFLTELDAAGEGVRERAVAFLGGITQERGIAELVDAMQWVDGTLYLAGRFNSEVFRTQCMQSKGWAKVVELGHINRKEAASLLGKVRGGILTYHPGPNHEEAQPTKLFEYMSAGIPIVISHFPYWISLCAEADCAVPADPQSATSVAKAINTLMDDVARAEAMGQRGKQLVHTKYNWEAKQQNLLKLYQQILAA